MSIETACELSDFHQFVAQKLANGETNLSPEGVVDLWREEHPSPEETDATVTAVLKALEAMKAGDKGVPAREYFARFRHQYS